MRSLNKKEIIAIFVSLPIVTIFFLFANTYGLLFTGGGASTIESKNILSMEQGESKFIAEDTIVGDGQEAKKGNLVTVHYVGVLSDGTPFDSSISRGEPFQFVLGAGQVIQGWDRGVAGMKVGGKRILVIPAELAYGDRAVGPIPANSTLIFEVELLEVGDTQ